MAETSFSARLAPLRRLLPPIGSGQAALWALGFLCIAALVRVPFDAAVNQRLPPFLTIYPAVVLASFAGGLRIGALTAVGGAFLAWILWLAPYDYEIPSYAAITGAAYILAVGVTVAASGLARHMLDACIALEAERAREARESVHRIKNLLSVVQAFSRKIARQTDDKAVFLERFNQRLNALASAQNVLVQSEWQATPLRRLVETALAPFMDNASFRLDAGPDLTVPAPHVSGLSLALYELASNSVKYGALSGEDGMVRLAWRSEAGRALVDWRENAVTIRKSQDGLGAALIAGAMRGAPDAHTSYAIGSGTIACTFDWAADA